MKSNPSSLPKPFPHPHHRWQPLRSGLVNLYKYDQEEFLFERGRMLLRGDNGTGKSRVLALQLPFLLDGETASYRVEPDGDPGRKFDWHLLMGKYPARTGYTWIEFGRADENGVEHFLTLGCGLKAVEGKGITDKWFFVTPQRIGESLCVVSESGIPLSRESLESALTEGGRLYRTAKEYRVAVDDALFHLGERRYEALVNLLIQLRKPQLSREFNETFLSSALSEALAPLDPEALSVIAEAYRGLDDDRTQLEGYGTAHKAVSIFLSEYTVYSRIASRRRAQLVRSTHASYEDVQRELKKADGELERAMERHHAAMQLLGRLRQEHAAALERVRTLENSPEMRSARELQKAREDTERCERRALDAENAFVRAQRKEEEASAQGRESKKQAELRRNSSAARLRVARQRAQEALFDPELLPVEDAGYESFDSACSRLDSLLESRRKAVAELEDLEHALTRLEAALEAARRNQAEISRHRAEMQERLEDGSRNFAREVAELTNRTRTWLAGLHHLKISDAEGILETFQSWSQSCVGDSPVRQAAQAALSELHQGIDLRKGFLQKEAEEIESRRAGIQRERQELEMGQHVGPAQRAGVSLERRRHAPGAPFWKSVDFVSCVDDAARAGIEAALEASGILDAWITPEGKLLSATEEETVLEVEGSPCANDSMGLARWLKPAIDRNDPQVQALSEAMIGRVLLHVGAGCDSGPVWVAEDGSWRLGPLKGKWSKSAAQHLGQGAREAERRRRIEELTKDLRKLDAEAVRIRELLTEIEQVRLESIEESQALPSPNGCLEALRKLSSVRDAVSQADLQLREAERGVLEAHGRQDGAVTEYEQTAEGFGLKGWRGRLREVRDGTSAFERALSELASAVALLSEAERFRAAAEFACRQACEERERSGEIRQSVLEELAAACALRDELQATIGSKAEDVLARLTEANHASRDLVQVIEKEEKTRETAGQDRVRFEERAGNLRTMLDGESSRRDVAIESLNQFVSTGLLKTACAELQIEKDSLSISGRVELSRRIETALSTVDSGDAAWERRSRAIYSHFTALQSALGALTYRAEGITEGEFFVVRIPFQQRLCPVDEIEQVFGKEVEDRQRLLEARERVIIENHLIGEISTHIHDRLHAAEVWKDLVNRELDERPTSTGMKLRFDWVVNEEGPPSFPEARRRLMRAAVTWSEGDRVLVAEFLHQRLQSERVASPHKTWFENLSAAFDYRAWHRFAVERQQDGRWQRLTKRTFGTGSGGEKAIMLTMPQFSAAAAHFRSASPLSPRLILLDEAFVGIDNRNRANAMGLLKTFDLDLVMTSEREWGCYPTVPGIAIYQLSARAGVEAVLATRWVWDGSRRYRPESDGAGWLN